MNKSDRHSKESIVSALYETAQLLKAKGESKFKVRAYMTAAKVVKNSDQNIATLVEERKLTDLPGIGTALAAFITEVFETGTTKLLTHLREELPPGTAEMIDIEGMTIKRLQILHEQLGIKSLQDLKDALALGKLQSLKGFGEKTQDQFQKSIQVQESIDTSEIRLLKARALAHELENHFKTQLKDNAFEISGEVRAWNETVDRLIYVTDASIDTVEKLMQKFPDLISLVKEDTRLVARAWDGVIVEIYCANNLALGLLAHTGKSEHFHKLQTMALAKGLQLSEENFRNGNKDIRVEREDDVYRALGLNYIPAEMRHGRNEIELASTDNFDDLLQITDIRGMTHCHTTYSDGIHTIEEMVIAAEALGMDYITITDHSPTAHYAGGLSIDRLKQQWDEIAQIQESVKIKILKGTECDILADGRLDYPDHILEQFDVIIASIHSRYRQNEESMTRRLLEALRNPHFKIWGHPLGRILLSRNPIPCDVARVLEAIQDARVAIEINGDPHRMDLPSAWAKVANDMNFKFIVSTDAHAISNYANLKYGIHLARRAGVRKKNVLNTRTARQFKKAVKPA